MNPGPVKPLCRAAGTGVWRVERVVVHKEQQLALGNWQEQNQSGDLAAENQQSALGQSAKAEPMESKTAVVSSNIRAGRVSSPHTLDGEKERNENRSVDRTHSAWPDFLGIWDEWFPALYSDGADAFRDGGPVPGRPLPVPLLVRSQCAASRGWRAFAGEPLCAAGAGAAGPGDREHPSLPCVHG